MAHSIQKHASLSPLEERLNDVIPGYRDHLERQGLGPSGVRKLAAVALHLVVWMRMNDIETGALDIRRIAEFASHDCACPGRLHCHASGRTRPQADRFLAYLMDTGRAEMSVPIVEGGRLVDAFVGSLSDQGYSDSAMRDYRLVCRHLVVWLFLSGLELARIDEDAIQRFLGHGCACSCPHFRRIGRIDGSRRHRAKVRKFADFLVGEGVIERWREAGPAPRSELVDGFLGWMRRHRGARETTVHEYSRLLHRKLLPGLAGDPAAWDAASIRNAFAVWSQSNTSRELARMTSVLRVYLRHLGAIGICRPELAGAVPAVRRQTCPDMPASPRSRRWSTAAIRRRPSAGGTARSCCSWPGWRCGPETSGHCAWTTSTGTGRASGSAASRAGAKRCRCPRMRATRSGRTFWTGVRACAATSSS